MDEDIVQVEIFHKDKLIYNEELPCELAADGEGHHIKFPDVFGKNWELKRKNLIKEMCKLDLQVLIGLNLKNLSLDKIKS